MKVHIVSFISLIKSYGILTKKSTFCMVFRNNVNPMYPRIEILEIIETQIVILLRFHYVVHMKDKPLSNYLHFIF